MWLGALGDSYGKTSTIVSTVYVSIEYSTCVEKCQYCIEWPFDDGRADRE